jgi:SAM-dependent methyltransferase
MHPAVLDAFEQICRREDARGRILEIGATPDGQTLLCMTTLAHAAFKIGINRAGAARYQNVDIVAGNANAMCFADAAFDVVMSNSVLEHDRRFWLTLREIRRVCRPGALIVLGVPGYGRMAGRTPLARLARLPAIGRMLRVRSESAAASTPTLGVHNFPDDFYRFSEQAMREVLLEGLRDVGVISLLSPPRFIGWGRTAEQSPLRSPCETVMTTDRMLEMCATPAERRRGT